MRTAALSLIAICLSAPVLADQPGGDMTGFLEVAPVSWRIDAERSEFHFESEGIGSLRILAEPQEVPSGIGSIRLMVMVADGTTSLLELRLEDEDGNPALGLSSQAGGQAMLEIDHNNLVIGAGILGYALLKLELEWAPFVLGFVLGPMLEHQLRRSMLISGGDPSVFVTRPISAVLLVLAVGLLILVSLPQANKARDEVFTEEV